MKRLSQVAAVLATVLAAFSAWASTQLDIPPRRQWDNNLGYCGECSIQQIALYYGTYISQYRVREIVHPEQDKDVRIKNVRPILDALRLSYECWDSSVKAPQYQDFLVWVKQQLEQGHPLLMAMYMQEGDNPQYDHIVTATGFEADELYAYNGDDLLIFNDNYWEDPVTRDFKWLPDNRSMNRNGAFFSYCIPRKVDYGCAVTGVVDVTGLLKPVSVELKSWDEPNLSLGEQPAILDARIRVRNLKVGKSYSLMRFDGYNIPTGYYMANDWSRIWIFKAEKECEVFKDRFSSEGVYTYRCVPTIYPPTFLFDPDAH